MLWSSAIAEGVDLAAAAAWALDDLADKLGSAPDLVVAFLSAHHADDAGLLADAVAARWPDTTLVGCGAEGVIGGGREREHVPAIALTAALLPEVDLSVTWLSTAELATAGASPWYMRGLLDVSADDPVIVTFPDPFSSDAEALVRALDLCWPEGVVVGGLASGARSPGNSLLLAGGQVHREGAVVLTLSGNIRVDTVVAQGCRPIGHPMRVTAARDNLLLELDRRAPGALLSELHDSLSEEDQALLRTSLFLGLVIDESLSDFRRGDFLIRNVFGVDADSGIMAVGAKLTDHQAVQFHVRDAATSAEDLREELERHVRRFGQGRSRGGLLFSCLGRGENLYGEPDHDSRVFAEIVGDVPITGFFCNGEVGPIGGRSFVHGYTSAFALFRPREDAG